MAWPDPLLPVESCGEPADEVDDEPEESDDEPDDEPDDDDADDEVLDEPPLAALLDDELVLVELGWACAAAPATSVPAMLAAASPAVIAVVRRMPVSRSIDRLLG